MRSETISNDLRRPSELAAQWYGILGGAFAWAFDLTISYAINQHACSTGKYYELLIVSLIAFGIALSSVLVAFRNYGISRAAAPETSDAPAGRTHFMGLLGLSLSIFFVLVIVAQSVPRFLLNPCD
jgi:hypothetical protein